MEFDCLRPELLRESRERLKILYQNELPRAHYDEAALLYESAFGEKFSRAIRNRQDRVSLIRNGFASEYAITAFADDRLVGIAGYHTPSGSLTGGITGRAIMNRLGLLGGIRACAILCLYERTPSDNELVMDGIAVHPEYRGCGIGTELLNRIVRHAEKQDFRTVRLDVVNTNPSARKLYERFGFNVTNEERYRILAPILGFGGSTTMEFKIA